MRTHKAIRNILANVLLQVVTVLSSFILPRLIMVVYGSAANGLLQTIKSALYYMNLVESGIGSSAIVAMYRPLHLGDHDAVNGNLAAVRQYLVRVGYFYVGLLLVASIGIRYFPGVNVLHFDPSILVLVMGLSGSVHYFFLGPFRVLLTADQRAYIPSLSQILVTILTLLAGCVLIRPEIGIITLHLVFGALYALQCVMLYVYVRRAYPYFSFGVPPRPAAVERRWDAMVHQASGVMVSATPPLLLAMVCGVKEVSVYFVYMLIVSGVGMMVNSLTGSLTSTFGELFVEGDERRLGSAAKDFEYLYLGIVATLYSVSFLLLDKFVVVYTKGVTDTIYQRSGLGALVVLFGVATAFKSAATAFVSAAGEYKATRRFAILEPLLLVGFSGTLGVWLGLNGIVAGMIVASLVRWLDLLHFVNRRLLKRPWLAGWGHYLGFFAYLILVIAVNGSWVQRRPVATKWDLVLLGFHVMAAVLGQSVLACVLFARREFKPVWARLLMIGRSISRLGRPSS